MFRQEAAGSGQDGPAFHLAHDAPAREDPDAVGIGQDQVRCPAQDGPANVVLRTLFHGGGQTQHFFFVPFRSVDSSHFRPAQGEGAGLVKSYQAHFPGLFQELAALDQHSGSGGVADARHHGDGGGDDQGPGTADDQQGEGGVEVAGNKAGEGGQGDDAGGVPAGEALDELLGRGLALLGFFDHMEDAGKGGVLPHPLGPDLDVARLYQGAAEDLAVRSDLHRDGLAGDGGLVDRSAALGDDAVHGYFPPRADEDDFAHLHVFGVHFYFRPLPPDHRRGGRQVQELLDGVPGPGQGPGFQVSPQGEEEGDGGGFPLVADEKAAHGGDGDQELNADDPGPQSMPSGLGDAKARDQGGGGHQQGAGQGRKIPAQPAQDDQGTGKNDDQQLFILAQPALPAWRSGHDHSSSCLALTTW